MDGAMTDPRVVALLCRTSDRGPEGSAGAQALAEALGERLGVKPRVVGSPGEPRAGAWEEDLRDSRGCILEAGGQVDDALNDGEFPVLLSSDCTICLTTIPAVLRHRPRASGLWLDAHGDFNTPDTTPSGFLGGMCLAGACGRWETGFEGVLDPADAVMVGARDLHPGGPARPARAGAPRGERFSQVADAVDGAPVYVHLDLDVLDPDLFPAQFA